MAPQQNLSQTRVVDPILSEHARGYRQAELIAPALFPFADVDQYGGKVIEFNDDSFMVYDSSRAPGSATKRITQGFDGKPYAIVPGALDAVVPREQMRDATQVPGINLASRAVNSVMRALMLEHELKCAALATTAANYDSNHKVTLTGGDVWSASTSDITGDIEDGREAVRNTIGAYPNTLMLSASAYKNCRRHASIIDRSANTGIRKVTLDLLRQIFEVENIVVGAGLFKTANTTRSDVWGNAAVLAYVSPGASVDADIQEPSFGYAYRIRGMPMVEKPYWDNGSKSWVYGVSNDCTPVLSGMNAGFLILGAGS